MPADKIVNDGLRGRQERCVASHAVVLKTFPPTLPQRHLALFPLVGEVTQQRMGAGRRTCHVLTTCQTPSS